MQEKWGEVDSEKEKISTEEFLSMENNNSPVSSLSNSMFDLLSGCVNSISDIAEIQKLVKDNNEDIDALIRSQALKSGAVGFATCLPGLPALVATLPADFACNLYNQVRLIAGIAYIRGYDLQNDNVKTMVLVCLAGEAATSIMKEITEESIKQVMNKVIAELLGKSTSKLIGKGVPLVGGLIGGTIDSMSTYTVGKVAKKMFPDMRTSNTNQDALDESLRNIRL